MKDRKKTKGQLIQDLDEMRQLINRAQMNLLQKEIEYLTAADPITGAYNRRDFIQMTEKEVERLRRHATPLSIAMFVIDHFEKIAGTYGNAAADLVLKEFVSVCRALLRPYDILGRVSGEEFAIAFSECDLQRAQAAVERIRKRVERSVLTIDGRKIRFGIRAGIAQITDAGEGIESAMTRAGQALDTGTTR